MALLSTTRGFLRDASAELVLLLGLLRDRSLAWLLLLTACMLTLVVQLPPHYYVNIGQEDGPGADLPLISGFNTPEQDSHGTFRWTSESASINLTGFGSRPLLLKLSVLPINAEMTAHGPQRFELWQATHIIGTLPVLPQGGSYTVLLPPNTQGDGRIELRSSTIVPSGDERALGIVLDAVQISGSAGAFPDWPRLLGWLAALLLTWLMLRRLGYAAATVTLMLLPVVALVALAAWLDAPRLSLGIVPALKTLGLALAMVLAMRARATALAVLSLLLVLAGIVLGNDAANLLFPTALAVLLSTVVRPQAALLWERLEQNNSVEVKRALALLAVLIFVLHYGGKIYPFSMPGDIGFHVNRFGETLGGRIFILSKNRGVDFPYPPALYIMLAPFTLLSSRRELVHLSAALLNAISPVLVYCIARRSGLLRSPIAALAAGALYGLCGALFMTTWWNFSTHIFAQFAHLLLLTVLVAGWGDGSGILPVSNPRPQTPDPRPFSAISAILLIVLQLLLYLAHFGFWMNMSLISAMGIAFLLATLLWTRRGVNNARFVLCVVLIAQLITVLLFYSAYTGLFLNQLSSAASGGFTGLAGRGAVPKDILWAGLIEGLYAHVGLLPLLLAPLALLLPLRSGKTDQARLTRVLMLTSFALGAGFAALPFLTGSTLSTRWLMFCLWAICVACAAIAERLWARGRASRLLLLSSAAYLFWLSASIWLSALAWRVRPPEPF